MLSEIRQDKKRLFAILGFISGAVGALFADMFNVTPSGFLVNLISTILWAAVATAFISIGLYGAVFVYNRTALDWMAIIKKAAPSGFIAGAISGGIAQLIYGSFNLSNGFLHFLFQGGCWGIMGLIMGWKLSHSIPNLNKLMALIAGLIGGTIGGMGFIIFAAILPELPGRMLGFGIIGAALGLCLVIIEEHSRSAYLEAHWGPNESNEYTLGKVPVCIGGKGTNAIDVPNSSQNGISISMENGVIKAVDSTSGETKIMEEGSKIVLGGTEFIVRSKK